jgi:ATP-dependent helicase/DNAse subunit B
MNVDYLRASTIGTYEDCPFKFFLHYVCNIESKGNKKAHCGTIVHHVLEIIAKNKKTGHYKLKDKYCDPDYLLKCCWNKYTKKIYPNYEWTQKDFDFCQKMVKIVMSDPKLNPLNLEIFAIEKQFEIDILKPGFKFKEKVGDKEEIRNFKLRGTIDLITKFDDDTLWVLDWKTGERKKWIGSGMKELEDFEKDDQLKIYNLAIRTLYPNFKNVMFTIVYIRDGGPFTVSFDDSQIDKTLDDIRRKFNKIRSDDTPTRLKDNKKRISEHGKCKFVCQFGKEKDENGVSLCDKYFRILKSNPMEEAQSKIYTLSIGKTGSVSRRNNYDHDKMAKGKIV